MSKEKILEEFENKYSSFELCNQISKPELDKLKNFLSKAIDQTEEEMIRKVEEMLPNRDEIAEDPIGYLERLEEDLNKLKK
jgi:hypothetical protein